MDRRQRNLFDIARRTFLLGAAGTAVAGVLPPTRAWADSAALDTPDQIWLGPDLWANRLQDWMVSGGQIRCVADSAHRICRTAAILTTSLGGGAFTITARTGTLVAGAGFSGFLIGTGAPGTDYRRAAAVMGASGGYGGLMAVYGSDGVARFRNHTQESNSLAFPELTGSTKTGPAPVRTVSEDVELSLTSAPNGDGTTTLTLRAVDAMSEALLSQAVRKTDPVGVTVGGVSLVSSGSGSARAAYWFSDVAVDGVGAVTHPERALGPVMGTLFSVTGQTLKMTAQLLPLAVDSATTVLLETTAPGDLAWTTRATADVGPGYAALLRVDDWDSTLAWSYRVSVSSGGDSYRGTIPAEPAGDRPLVVAAVTCTKASHRPFDAGGDSGGPKLPGEQFLYRFDAANAYFPHEQLTGSIAAQGPDVFACLGDQFYETSPTVKDTSPAPTLDLLYRWYLWHWAFREITRDRPTVILVDDHDVFQGNIFGEDGQPLLPGQSYDAGGYANDPAWVNVVQRIQCGHNPDPYDSAPVLRGITVYFTAFTYGGARFVLLEDRKFKSPATGIDQNGVKIPTNQLQLLGSRQEAMLAEIANPADDASDPPTVVFTQTMYASLETNQSGIITANKGTNGWPVAARDRALTSIKAFGGCLVSGDTHLPALVHHGITSLTDGPIQFSVPAGSTSVQRWFEPATALPNAREQPYTGDAVDGFHHHMRVLAVANMAWTQQQVVKAYGNTSYGRREFKQEGYGVVRIDPTLREYTFEAWRWDSQPTNGTDVPMPGWPVVIPFDQA